MGSIKDAREYAKHKIVFESVGFGKHYELEMVLLNNGFGIWFGECDERLPYENEIVGEGYKLFENYYGKFLQKRKSEIKGTKCDEGIYFRALMIKDEVDEVDDKIREYCDEWLELYVLESTLEQKEIIEQEILMALGRVTIEYSKIERMLAAFIELSVAGHHDTAEIGRAITARLSIENMAKIIDTISRSVIYKDDEGKIEELYLILSEAVELNNYRNKVVHANWKILEGGNYSTEKVTKKMKKGLIYQYEYYTSIELNRKAREMESIAKKMMKYIDDNVENIAGADRDVIWGDIQI